MTKRNNLLAILFLLLAGNLFAGGFRVSLQGVRQAALGGQGTALAGDASAMFYNPAAIAFVQDKWSVSVGGFGVSIKSEYSNPKTLEKVETSNPLGTPVYGALSYKPIDDLALGVSLSTPYGTTVSWGNNWSAKYVINEISLKSYFVQPTVAYKFNDWFSIGGGAIIARGGVNIQKEVPITRLRTQASLEIDAKEAKGWGLNLGVFVKPTDKMNIGLSYRSEVEMEVNGGDVKWEKVPAPIAGIMPFATTNFNAKLPLPAELLFGLNYMITPKLMIGGEIAAVNWSTYKKLQLDLYKGANVVKNVSRKEFENTVNYSFGAEYFANPNLALRLGYKFDESPSPDKYFNPETPTVDYHAITGGIGYTFSNFTVDLMGEYIKGEGRDFLNEENKFGGNIISNGFLFGLGLSYGFGN